MGVHVNEDITLQEKVAALPLKPGVYQFLDENGKLLYIGKAVRLRQRVQSYFRSSTKHSAAKQRMVAAIRDIETTVVDTEPEALLLETTLIKKYKPPYNVVMKDDKSFQYIHITDDIYPSVETTRHIPLKGRSGTYYGPYTSGGAVKRTLRLLKNVFGYCTQLPTEGKDGEIILPKRPCLDYHLERCIGPCAGEVTPEEYQKLIGEIHLFLKGEYEDIAAQIQKQMEEAAQQEKFEKAATLRDQLASIEKLMIEQKVVSAKRENADYLSLVREKSIAAVNVFTVRKGMLVRRDVFTLRHVEGQTDEEILEAFKDQYYAHTEGNTVPVYMSTEGRRGRHRKMLEMGAENAREHIQKIRIANEKRDRQASEGLAELAEALGMKPEELQRIETYDNSNFQGKYPVSSMVVFVDGQPKPSEYRKFKIKTVTGPDDFASMREVINRRIGHLPSRAKKEKDKWARPDLIVIDGGKGQLSAAKAMLDIIKSDIPIISLAKREEEIFIPGREDPILLKKDSPGYYLIQRMRDEAHRFAIGFYRRRHLKGLLD